MQRNQVQADRYRRYVYSQEYGMTVQDVGRGLRSAQQTALTPNRPCLYSVNRPS